jgi:hypothetical protein
VFFLSPVYCAVLWLSARGLRSWSYGSLSRCRALDGGGVLLVGYVVAPGDRRAFLLGDGFGEGEMGHEAVLSGSVPVPFTWRGVDGLAGVYDDRRPPRAWTSAMPSVTRRVWPRAWTCQAVRDPGAKRTMPAVIRCGRGRGWATGSTQTSPVNLSAGPLVVGCRPSISTVSSSLTGGCRAADIIACSFRSSEAA